MNAAVSLHTDNSLKALSRSINQPAITLAAVVLALVLGALRLPFLQHLQPVGDFYIALLQICVLPFLLATIPLAVRSAMASGSAPGVIRSLLFWVLAAGGCRRVDDHSKLVLQLLRAERTDVVAYRRFARTFSRHDRCRIRD